MPADGDRTPSVLFRNVGLAGRRRSVLVRDGRVARLGASVEVDADIVVDGRGGALLPGLHDHHCHLLAAAAAAASVPCGPPAVTKAQQLAAALAAAAPARDGWVRGVGYDDAVAGPLDRDVLDAALRDRPVRVQHRSGALWALNSAAIGALDLERVHADGVERDAAGRLTGRLWRLDRWLAERLVPCDPPDLAALGAKLAALGVTGVTDATPDPDGRSTALLAAAHADGSLPQRILVMAARGSLPHGPRKIVLSDHALPGWDALTETVLAARSARRSVAFHSVTRESLLLALAVLDALGARPGDRIEHAAIAPPPAIASLARLGVAVVTQPALLAARGDDYLRRVAPSDLPDLWRYASLLAAGVRVAPSSDAPYGDIDPWETLRAAARRRTPSGRVIAAAERVPAATALHGYLTEPASPGGALRRVLPGAAADLVLLDAPLAAVLADPSREHVRLTMIAGRIVHCRA